MNKIGVMQGRLLPKYKGRYQAHPVNYWAGEFQTASKLALDLIEFIVDYNDFDANPLLSDSGLNELLGKIQETSVQVSTICADYFMEAPLHSKSLITSDQSHEVLKKLIAVSGKIGVTDIVVPCVDQSRLENNRDKDFFVKQIDSLGQNLAESKVNISIESDLNPEEISNLLSKFESANVRINYDIGNSASLGFDPSEEIDAYGDKISDVHIKDRVLHGGPVELGTGVADFDKVFKKLRDIKYSGPFIMQAYRDDEGVEIFKSQLIFAKKLINKYFN